MCLLTFKSFEVVLIFFHKIFVKWYMITEYKHIFIDSLEILNTGFKQKKKTSASDYFASVCIISSTYQLFY